ncbi:MAG: hypothetical protein K8R53_09975 [Bacteroidales bacterium]|nr:hypothetical protein [Bacteroidales bacterium]
MKNKFSKLSRPEKIWVICHPFVAKKAFVLTEEVLKTTDSIACIYMDCKVTQGGSIDAFKHSYWMAMLASKIRWRKAWKLGKAHEKGNYIVYKKGKRKGLSALPDKISSKMDCWNNLIGIDIGSTNRNKSTDLLILAVLDSLNAGKLRIVNRDLTGNFIDCDGEIISPDSLISRWDTPKCLVPSRNINK